MSEKKSNSLPGWTDMTVEELEERIRNGPSEQEIAEHFGYKQLLEGGSYWFNDPGNAERLLSGLPELLRQYGPDKCYRIIFDYDPDYSNMLLQVSVRDPAERKDTNYKENTMNKSLLEKLEIIAERHANATARLISNETHDDTRIVISDINGAINSLCTLVKTIEDLRRSDNGRVDISEEQFRDEMKKAILKGFVGTKQFYENITVPGLKVKSVDASQGRVHVTLTAKAGLDAEALRKQYLRACKLKAPITDVVTASVEIENSNA